jgi:peptidoglycan/xylan/chitin deacetylase (PgdA/CDA1 family)
MPIRISSLVLGLLLIAPCAHAEVIERLPTTEKVVALTFDACEASGQPAFLDETILDVLAAEKVPYTIFATGLFARRNAARLAALAANPGVRVENHSLGHPRHMERLDGAAIRREVEEADAAIAAVTGRKPRFFRFPGGDHDARSLAEVEATGHRVVHWSFASGDPARGMTPEHLGQWVLSSTRPGSILIFHVNRRAPATGPALPGILAGLRSKGYRFVSLEEALP